jgi:predicted HTH domain antitoxin
MALVIPDDILREAGLGERDALIEFACWLFDSGRAPKEVAARMCGLDRVSFEAELYRRNLAVYRTTAEEYEQDLKHLSSRKVG